MFSLEFSVIVGQVSLLRLSFLKYQFKIPKEITS